MAIAHVNSTNNSATNTSSITLNKPASVSTGDLMVGVITASNTGANVVFSIPTGWTPLADNSQTGSGVNTHGVVCYRYVQAGDPSSWTTTGDRQAAWVSITSAYSGIDPTTPFIVYNDNQTNNTTPTVNNTNANAWRVAAWMGGHATLAMSWLVYSPTDTERQDLDINGSSGSSNHSAAALVDSNATIATGNTSVTATPTVTPTRRFSWIGILNPAAGGTDYTSTPSEAEGLTDTRSISQGKTKSEAEGLTDSTAKSVGKVQSDPEGLTDSLSKVLGRAFSKTEAFGSTDTVSFYLNRVFNKTDTQGLTDAIAFSQNTQRSQSDSEGLSDSISKAVAKTLSEALGVVDSTAKDVGKTKSDALGATDSVSYQLSVVTHVNLSESEEVSDAVSYVLSHALTDEESDSLGLTDILSVSRSIGSPIIDSSSLTDSISFALGESRTSTEQIGLSDVISRVATYSRAVVEDAGLTDNVVVVLYRYLDSSETDTIGLADTISFKVGIKPVIDDAFLGLVEFRFTQGDVHKSYRVVDPTKKWTLDKLHRGIE